MRKVLSISLMILLLSTFSCRKDPLPSSHIPVSGDDPFSICEGSYEKYSTTDFFKDEDGIMHGNISEPTYYPQQDIMNCEPVFNPNNPYEIVFVKDNMVTPTIEEEIWRFNFCTGEQSLIATNYYYNLDFGSNGWIMYTGTGHQVYKVKSNGDSLTALTNQGGYNWAGDWSPDGKKYFYSRSSGAWVYDLQNNLVYSQSSSSAAPPIAWIDNTHLLLNWPGGAFWVADIETGEKNVVNTHTEGNAGAGKVYDSKRNVVYAPHFIHLDGRCYLKYDLNNNTVDTLKHVSNSYVFEGGSYSPSLDKIITTVVRYENKDGNWAHVNFWKDLLIMNPDGTGEQLITLPE